MGDIRVGDSGKELSVLVLGMQGEEERLLRVNAQLKQRVEEGMYIILCECGHAYSHTCDIIL